MNWWVISTRTLNYIEHFLILVSAVTRYILYFAFVSLLNNSIRIKTFEIGLKFVQKPL